MPGWTNNICGVPKTLEVQTIMQVMVSPFLVIKVCGPSEDTNGDLILGDLQGWFNRTLADCYKRDILPRRLFYLFPNLFISEQQ